jgi:hypothetical protein
VRAAALPARAAAPPAAAGADAAGGCPPARPPQGAGPRLARAARRFPPALLAACEAYWRASVAPASSVSGFQLQVDGCARAMGLSPQLEHATPDGLLRVDLCLQLGGRLVALEADGPSHFMAHGPRRRRGHTVLRDRLLAARGYLVVSVRQQDWASLASQDERAEHLRRLLERALAREEARVGVGGVGVGGRQSSTTAAAAAVAAAAAAAGPGGVPRAFPSSAPRPARGRREPAQRRGGGGGGGAPAGAEPAPAGARAPQRRGSGGGRPLLGSYEDAEFDLPYDMWADGGEGGSGEGGSGEGGRGGGAA